jgi:hypothetical protein
MLVEWQSRWPDFKPEEVLSAEGLYALNEGALLINVEALDKLQSFRVHLGQQIIVNFGPNRLRGYRSPTENTSIRGARYSMHVQGVAFDITVPGMAIESLAEQAEAFGWHGIGIYPSRKFVHVDRRPSLRIEPYIWRE